MDVLSDVVASMRVGDARAALAEWWAPWGQEFRSGGSGAGFVVVLRGPAWLVPSEGAARELGVGDVVFLPHGDGFGLADGPSRAMAAPMCGDGGQPMHPVGTGKDGARGVERRFGAPAFVGPGHRAGELPTTVTLCGAYHLDRSRSHPLLADLPSVVHVPARPVGDADPRGAALRAAVDLLGAELTAPGAGTDVVVPALLDTLLIYLLRAWYAAAAEGHVPGASPGVPSGGWSAALADPVVSAALDAIHRDPGAPWTVESLGSYAGLSRAAFARRFTVLVGRPPLAYLTWWRLTSAARLLRGTDAPLARVAEQVGYTSEFAFANAFKREFGQAPGRYRRGAA